MKIIKKTQINQSIENVWKVIATDFHLASQWMSPIVHSYAKNDGEKLNGAPMTGRVCEMKPDSKGMYLEEKILSFDQSKHEFTFEVTPKNGPPVMPINTNIIKLSLKSTGLNQCEITWESQPRLKILGILMYPVLLFGMGTFFKQVLEELKFFVEEGKVHPRKTKALSHYQAR